MCCSTAAVFSCHSMQCLHSTRPHLRLQWRIAHDNRNYATCCCIASNQSRTPRQPCAHNLLPRTCSTGSNKGAHEFGAFVPCSHHAHNRSQPNCRIRNHFVDYPGKQHISGASQLSCIAWGRMPTAMLPVTCSRALCHLHQTRTSCFALVCEAHCLCVPKTCCNPSDGHHL